MTSSKTSKSVPKNMLDSSNFLPVGKGTLDFFKRDIHSWKWCWACGRRLMLVGLGRNVVEAWDMKGARPVFSQKRELQGLELPKGTVIEVELVPELQGEGRGQRKQETVYIVDVIAIHGKLYADKPLKERQDLARKLCKVLNKPCRRGNVLLKTKMHYRLTDLSRHFEGLSLRECKGHPKPGIPTYPVSEDIFIAPMGVIFFKAIRDPWQLHLSKTGKFYFFNKQTGESSFECPTTSVATYLSVLGSRHLWQWKRTIFQDLCGEEDAGDDSDELTRSLLCHEIRQILGHKTTD